MFNSAFFVRCLIAVVLAVLLLMAIPAVLRLVGFPVSGDIMTVVRVCIAAAALWYIFKG